MGKSKLIPFIALGALAGAVISMLDKETRTHTQETVKKAKDTVTYYAGNRDELEQLILSKVEQVQSIYSNASENVQSLITQAQDVKALPMTLKSMLTDTKETL